jgi:hypothetical protein
MMGFTSDKQVDPAMVSARDQRFGVSTEDRRHKRADIATPPIAEGADAWLHGQIVQIDDPTRASR